MNLNIIALLAITIPTGSEIFMSEDSVYAERDKVDLTFSIFDQALADQARAEFKETFDDPSKARAGVEVLRYESGAMAGYPSTVVVYTKPARLARLDDQGKIEVVPALETTRQTYIDLGDDLLVITIWTKRDDVDIHALSEEVTTTLTATQPIGAVPSIQMQIEGVKVGVVGETFDAAPIERPLTVNVVAAD